MKVGWKDQIYEITVYFLFILVIASISTSDVKDFDNLEGIITSFSYSQADNNVLYSPPDNGSSSPLTESLALNGTNEIRNENYGLNEISSFEQSFEFDEPLFPDVNLGETFLTDTFEGTFSLCFQNQLSLNKL